MATIIEYALMAGGSYISTRNDINKFPIPNDWIKANSVTGSSGFEATSFTKGSELVISFAGTYPTDVIGDQFTGLPPIS